MNESEEAVAVFLSHSGYGDLVFEPDGNVPPDFLVGGRIAVEVRRLNQNEETENGYRGLEEVRIPLREAVARLLPTLGPSIAGESWYVVYRFWRPLPSPGELKKGLQAKLATFLADPANGEKEFTVGQRFRVELLEAGRPYSDFFVLGGFTDRDSGGFVLSEMSRNIRICVQEKTGKVAAVRSRYPEWWLCLDDHIGYGLGEEDRAQLRTLLRLEHNWDKIIVVNPEDPRQGYEV